MVDEASAAQEQPPLSFVERIAAEYPEAYRDLKARAGMFAQTLRSYEKSVNHGSQSLEAGLTPEQADTAYETLAQEFIGFVLDVNRDVIEGAEGRQYKDDTSGRTTVPGEKIKKIIIEGAISGGNSIPPLLDAVGRDKSTGWKLELYNSSSNPQVHQRLVAQEPHQRAVRTVGLGIAAWMSRRLEDGTLDMFKRDLEKSGVTTPKGNPIDVARQMVQKAGFPPRGNQR